MIGWLNEINRLASAGCPGMTRLLAGNAGGGGSVGGAANIAAVWCWCCAWDLSARCEVDRWGPGPCGDSVTCFARPRGVPLTVLLLLLRLCRCRLLGTVWPGPGPGPTKAPKDRGTCVESEPRCCGVSCGCGTW